MDVDRIARAGHWADTAGCRRIAAGGAQRLLPDLADLLAQSEERRELQRCHADAAVSLDSLGDLESVPITASAAANPNANFGMFTPAAQMGGKPMQILGNLASITRGEELATVTHYDIQPVMDIYGNIDKTDLRSVADKIRSIIDKHRKELPPARDLVIRGQVQTMRVLLRRPGERPVFLDPACLPADRRQLPVVARSVHHHLRAAGRARRHRVDPVPHRHTHLSVPALTGSIMCMGVATANSILVVIFRQGATGDQ